MKDLVFTNASEVAEFAYKKAYDLEDIGCVQVVGFYEEISDVLKEILQYDEVSVGNIELNSADWNGYLKEYYLTIDEDMVVCVEPGYYTEKEIYLQYEAETLIICDDCNSAIVKNNMYEGGKSYCYRYDDDCDLSCCDCEKCMYKHLSNDYPLEISPVFNIKISNTESLKKWKEDLNEFIEDVMKRLN